MVRQIAKRKIFIDTSAWVALFYTRDRYHQEAVTFWQALPSERAYLVTNDYVLDETYTILRRGRYGLAQARLAHQIIEDSNIVDIIEMDAEYRMRAWQLFERYEDKVLSFTDCICFAMMHHLGIYQAFAFDDDYAQVGFVVRP